jgi:hypothetical protein
MTLDTSVMNVSIATVAKDVGTTVTGIQGAITAYTLVMASLMITGAKVGAILAALAIAALFFTQRIPTTQPGRADQSLHARQGATTTNGDGFGVGWYDESETPRVYRSTHPAWNDRNLRELAAGISSPLFFAHIRASTGTAIQETNTHPFRHGRWLWMHNGLIREFPSVRRELVLAVDDSLYPSIEGTTDSEAMFYLAPRSGSRVIPWPRSSKWSASSRTPDASTGSSTPSR